MVVGVGGAAKDDDSAERAEDGLPPLQDPLQTLQRPPARPGNETTARFSLGFLLARATLGRHFTTATSH